jgi:hypothetical protein
VGDRKVGLARYMGVHGVVPEDEAVGGVYDEGHWVEVLTKLRVRAARNS